MVTLVVVADPIFADPRLVEIHDQTEGDRVDLDHYLAIITELAARTVLDVGCGTGTFASLLAEHGYDVTGLDPAEASLDLAKTKPGAQRVRWIHGDVTALPPLAADVATMTGNVTNVFLTEQALTETLSGIRAALRPGGHLVFETRSPAGRWWLNTSREATRATLESPEAGLVETWVDVISVDGDTVSYRRTCVFTADGTTLTSDSTRRFWPRAAVEEALSSAGYEPPGVRDAPDRPDREWVFIARRA